MFKIVNNASTNDAVRQHQFKKEVAKLPARELLREKSSGAISQIDKAESQYVRKADVRYQQDAVRNARMYKKDYERTLPETLAPETQSQMWKRAKQLKDEFTHGMLTKSDLHPVKGFMENGSMKWVVDEEKIRTNRSVDRELAWQRKNEPKINEFKNIMRHLNPNDPNAGDVEKFRIGDKKNV